MTRRLQHRLGALASLGALSSGLALATLALGIVIAFGIRDEQRAAAHARAAAEVVAATPIPRAAPMEPVPLEGVLVLAATKSWTKTMHRPLRAGEPVPVLVTAYCLSGTTRRGRYVRPGIVAADRKLFPLSRYIELYAGEKYLGRFLIDDTGSKIRGAHIDVWVPTCREATIFGRQHGTAMLLPRPELQVVQAGAAK
ncbi:MAG TPA: 3D domain-containing protein [Gemmatimonadaceae bacterium]